MNRLVIRVAASALLALGFATSAGAQTAPRDCNRQCLLDLGEQYLRALAAHNPRAPAISPDARYTENGVELIMPDGIWRTITAAGPYRLTVADPQTGTLGLFSTMEENGAPLILASRLKIENRQITRIETTIARRESQTSAGAGAAMGPRPEGLTDRPQFSQVLPQDQRRPRWQMIEIANSYFSALENNNGVDHVPPFADDCHRIENGMATTNRPRTDPNVPAGPGNFSCREAFALGYYREDTRLRDRRFLAVDEERGLVYAHVYFDHDAALRSYQLRDGRPITVRRTGPWTWMIAEVFQIRNGQISQVEAVLLSVPYGMRPNWDDGVRMPSLQEETERAHR